MKHRKIHSALLAFSSGIVVLAIASQVASAQLSVTRYGAKCNWNGTTGTDDTAAFQSAATAASHLYGVNGSVARVLLPMGQSCVVGGTVTIGSGVLFEGPGSIVVPAQTGSTLQFQNADKAGVENLLLKIISGPGGNNAALSVISWSSTSGDGKAHNHFVVRNNTVVDGSWGIVVSYSSGTGSLSNVDISGNTVLSSNVFAYSNADGIHVAGRVSSITVNGNRVSNRGDAAIALTSEVGTPAYILSGATVSNNICLNDSVGLDNSGATNTTWSNNKVRATLRVSGSNPAARSIVYGGVTPVDVKFIGNYLENYQGTGTDKTAKVDDVGSNTATNVDWIGNTVVGANAMWLAANTVVVTGNFFSSGATVFVNYDTGTVYPTQNIKIGKNFWLGTGTISANGNPGLYVNNTLAPQQSNSKLTIVGQSNFTSVP
jgi:hypothetical protein